MMPATLHHRDDLGVFLNELGLVGEGAEIGVAFGGFSRIILSKWHGRILHLVDLWAQQPEGDYQEQTNRDNKFHLWYEDCYKLAAEMTGRVQLKRGYSHEQAASFDDGFLDFAYIDANHDYKWVKQDVEAWWPKIKPGGILAGHDYGDYTTPLDTCFVKKAVDEFCQKEFGTPPFLTDDIGTWYVFKP